MTVIIFGEYFYVCCVCVVFCVILGLAINCIRDTRIFPAYCTSLVITLLLHVSGYIDAILSESTTTTKNRKK